MAKLAYGVPDKHILKSQGSDIDLMKFYCTQNATTYGAKWEKFVPRSGGPSGSGYVSNIRPTITYTSQLDAIDNPTMG
jgi:protein phosphatase 1 regulatory subunit 32